MSKESKGIRIPLVRKEEMAFPSIPSSLTPSKISIPIIEKKEVIEQIQAPTSKEIALVDIVQYPQTDIESSRINQLLSFEKIAEEERKRLDYLIDKKTKVESALSDEEERELNRLKKRENAIVNSEEQNIIRAYREGLLDRLYEEVPVLRHLKTLRFIIKGVAIQGEEEDKKLNSLKDQLKPIQRELRQTIGRNIEDVIIALSEDKINPQQFKDTIDKLEKREVELTKAQLVITRQLTKRRLEIFNENISLAVLMMTKLTEEDIKKIKVLEDKILSEEETEAEQNEYSLYVERILHVEKNREFKVICEIADKWLGIQQNEIIPYVTNTDLALKEKLHVSYTLGQCKMDLY